MPTYKVTSTRQVHQIDQSGGQIEKFRVFMTTGKGSTGFIDVDPDDWTQDKLGTILSEFAAKLDLAHAIQG